MLDFDNENILSLIYIKKKLLHEKTLCMVTVDEHMLVHETLFGIRVVI